MVIKPTPPGTGVIHEAFGATFSKSTSPYSLKPDLVTVDVSRFMPTSITTTPFFNHISSNKILFTDSYDQNISLKDNFF